jgi:hypothetical protein
MTDFEVTVDTSAAEEMVAKMQQKLMPESLTSFLIAKAHRVLRNRAEERFANEGDEVSGPWKELAYATSRIRAFQGYGAFEPINVRTGALRRFVLNSFTVKQQSRGVTLMMPGPASGEMLSKFKTAQQGSIGHTVGRSGVVTNREGPNRPAPARPVLGLGEIDADLISHELLDWIRAGIF